MVTPAMWDRTPRWILVVLPRLAFYPFLAASLLVFPAGLPWMILGWLVLWGFQVIRGKAGWPPLAFCLGVVIVKRVDWPPGLILLGILILAIAGLDFGLRRKRKPLGKTYGLIGGVLLVITWLTMAWTWDRAAHTSRHPALELNRPIGIIGDSLSSGGYASDLSKRLRIPVVDVSRGGITALEGLDLFPDLLKRKPQAVVIELGGHDYLKGRTRQETRETLERMIHLSRDAGAEVFLFEVPRGFITDPFSGLERELARKYDLELISDGAIRDLVLLSPFMPLSTWFGPHLSYDGLHPNEAGNEFLAERVKEALRRVYGDTLVK